MCGKPVLLYYKSSRGHKRKGLFKQSQILKLVEGPYIVMSKRRKYLLSKLVRYEKRPLRPASLYKIISLGLNLWRKAESLGSVPSLTKLNQWLDSDQFSHSALKFSTELTHWVGSFFYLPDCSIKGKKVYSGWYYIDFIKRYKKFAKKETSKVLPFRNTYFLWHMKKRLTKRLVRIVKRKTRKPVFNLRHSAKQSNNLFIIKAKYTLLLPLEELH